MKRVSIAALIAATLFSANQASGQSLSDNAVKIGILTDMSGGFADLAGQGSVDAASMAVADYKQEMNPPFAIELIYADHQNKADIGSNIARSWYDRDGVDAIFDVTNSAVALAVSAVTQDKNRILIATGGGTTRLTNENCSPNTISYAWDTYGFANGLASAVTGLGYDSWYIISVDYALGHTFSQDATNAIVARGGKVLGKVAHPIGTADFASFILQAQASGAKAIGIANAGADLHNALKTAVSFGLPSKQLLVPFAATMTDIRALGLDMMQGTHVIDAFYGNLNDETRSWSDRYQKAYKRYPNFVHASTYSAVRTYLKAVQDTRSDTAATVMKQLKSTKISDMFTKDGHIRQDGRMVHDLYLLKVKRPAASSGPNDLVELVSTIAGDRAFQPLSESRCKLVNAK
jgi:branched-chain amino acid transport system substrate-binding protein